VTREDARQVVHLGTTALAVALRWLPPWAGWVACGVAIAIWWIVVPLVAKGRGLFREDEPFVNGIRMYPVAVLAVLVLFPLPAAVAAWGVMGVGDAMSNLAGRHFGRPPFLGRDDRSFVGSAAFAATAWPAAWALSSFVGEKPAAETWLPALVAALAGTAVELVPLPKRVDDNLPIALAAAAAFHLAAR
jgi:dolichol kinase